MNTCEHEWTQCAGLGTLLCVFCVAEQPCPGCDECAFAHPPNYPTELMELWKKEHPEQFEREAQLRAERQQLVRKILDVEKEAIQAWKEGRP